MSALTRTGDCGTPCSESEALRRSASGYTLIELVIVVSMMVMLLGIGVAGYLVMGRRLGADGRMAEVENALREARNFAVRSGSFSRVEIDAGERSFTPVGFQVFGLWHMEDDRGAFGRDLVVTGATRVRGRTGMGLFFNASGQVAVYAGDPEMHTQTGWCVEAWIFPMLSGQDQCILRKKDEWDLKLTRNGNLEGGGKTARAVAGDYYLPLHRWAKVSLIVEPGGVQILVDDILRGESKEGPKLPAGRGRFQISDPTEPFIGVVDEVRLLSLVRGRSVRLPDDWRIAAPVRAVYFAASGELSSAHHGGELKFDFFESDRIRSIVLGRSGLVRQRTVEKYEAPASPPSRGAGPSAPGGSKQ